MDIAKIIQTGDIISSIDLTLMDDHLIENLKSNSQFECPECEILLTPASYKNTNDVAPYFTPASKKIYHDYECLYNEKTGKLKKIQNTVYHTENEIPFRFPNGLKLRDSRPENSHRGNQSHNEPRLLQKNYQASSLFAICKTFALFPLARKAMPLIINGINGSTYHTCFSKLQLNIPGQKNKILYGLSAWNSAKSSNDNIEISLLAWDTFSNTSQKINLLIDCSTWSDLTKRSFYIELYEANKKAKEATSKGSKTKTWIFFIGTQDETGINKFRINNRKLISIIYTTI